MFYNDKKLVNLKRNIEIIGSITKIISKELSNYDIYRMYLMLCRKVVTDII